MLDFLQLVGVGLVAVIPVANPLTSTTLLLALGGKFSQEERDRQVDRATFFVAAIILTCFYAGSAIMYGFGISLPGLRIAGGLIVAYIGFGMLFPGTSTTETEAQLEMAPDSAPRKPRDISFVPLALPGTAGPGTIALIISGAATLERNGPMALRQHLAVLTITALVALTFWACLRNAHKVVRVLGESGIDAASRLMGFLLICMGVQFVIDGGLQIVADRFVLV